MSDKEIILKTIDHIKNVKGFKDIKEFWNTLNITDEDQIRLKIKLEENNLATPHIYNAWDMMITTAGLKIKPCDLNDQGNTKEEMEIRKDLIEIENELNRALLIAAKLKEYDDEWVHNKYKEDMRDIYDLPIHLSSPLDQVYADGRQMGMSFSYSLTSFNNVAEHSTVYSWVKHLEEDWLAHKSDFENLVQKAEQIQINIARKFNSISQMLYTLKNQIKLLDDTAILLTIIKGKSIYLNEERAINKTFPSSVELVNSDVTTFDVFMSHASEDKVEFVEPLCELLENNGITLWYDKNEILWGDSIVRKINQGLSRSRFAIVVLSTNFIQKNWPNTEMEAVLNIETSSGEVRVLPLLIGSEDEIKLIINKYPLIAGKRYLKLSDGHSIIVNALKQRISNV